MHNISGKVQFISCSLFLSLLTLLTASGANAQEIVTDPVLNQSLIKFQQNFPQYIQEHPELTSGSTQPIELNGGKGKVKFNFAQQGQYMIAYDSLQFSATEPISADQFNIKLTIKSIVLLGDAS